MVRNRKRQKGMAVIEAALMMPWICFLFIGVFDFGFYSFAAIAVENAARVAALYTSTAGGSASTDASGACFYVAQELSKLPNVGNSATCSGTGPAQVMVNGTSVATVTVQATTVGGVAASQVTVAYQSIQLIPLPMLTGRLNLSRTVWMSQ